MNYKLLTLVICAFIYSTSAFAQGSVSGTVTDSRTGEELPGVNVIIEDLQLGASTDIDGEYEIPNVPEGTYNITVTYIGYKSYSSQIQVGNSSITHDVSLEQDVLGLEEVVVTGVGSGTQTTKLGFSVSKVGERSLQEVPAPDVGSALQAKVPGVTIVKASGDPSVAASIRLRGSTSINGDQSPLIIVDGVITDGSLSDINMQDVESIEIVKGAAGSSLYGSLAGNGVIQIITKRASRSIDKPTFTVRTEYGFSEIAKDFPTTDKHPWVNDAVLTSDGKYVESWPGYGTFDEDRVFDNDYPVTYNNTDAIYTGQPYNTNYINVANSSGNFNYFLSFEDMTQSGIVKNLNDYNRQSVRLNADYLYDEKFKLAFSGSYVNTEYPDISEQGQGSNFFYSALSAPPAIDFTERNADGTYTNDPTGYSLGSNEQNPLYVAENFQDDINRERYIVGLNLSYQVADWLSLNARQSIDQRYQLNTVSTPVGYQTPTPSQAYNNGYEGRTDINQRTAITELWAASNFQLDDFNINLIGKYLYEDREYERYNFSGYNYSVSGIRSFGALDASTFNIGNLVEEERVENLILDATFDYRDKIIVGGMVRSDGSSAFGEDERYNVYYRGSLAYRVSEDIEIDNIDELKLRASYGTSGNRPPFEAQYETYEAGSTVLLPDVLGNAEIKPSVVAELELGVDVAFLGKYNFVANYALANITNDYLLAPLTGTSPFSHQWQNVGEIENKTLELGLSGNLVNTRDLQAGFNLSFSTTSQVVTDLGGIAPFTRGVGGDEGAAIDLFRFEEGVEYGAMYGNKFISSLDELTVVDGTVVNIPGGYSPADFTVNSLGHVVLTENQGTELERPMYLVDENGDPQVVNIGSTQPDFQLGLSGNFNYKNLGLFMVWDWSEGGKVYNYTRELLYNRNTHQDLEDYTKEGYDPQYLLAIDGLYNGSEAVSHFVEDGSFVKLRELSLSYTFTNQTLGSLGEYLRDIKVSVVGRNLLTFTEYTGYDPEVALRSNSTNFRIDEFAYPNFRTYSASVQVRF
ncbi:SusC/RagA family TonB-linked outer membrane protein [Rhodohalobacter sp. 614A]|uniref:SusC/RagA family TonB-linked outer membrane protein n=1 Tax=Rhodohalobacter sp. 614A TaxID=2908649 RepID=UPI001F34B4DB|nr:SusC/RagA family TonB-linked outer membrane protein [Rhodohalobacter sp. 614A]